MSQQSQSKVSLGILASLCMLMSFASISTDLYLPAMPIIGQDLVASAGMLEWTVTGYLIGFSLGQFLWGPIGDRYGRRWPVIFGIIFFIIGSAGCALATSLKAMILCRLIQSIGSCACVVLSRAMVRDLYQGHKAAQMMSILITIMAIAPLIGPYVGGQVLAHAGWRAIFWCLVCLGGLSFIVMLFMTDTLPAEKRLQDPLNFAFKRYWLLLQEPGILKFTCIGGFYYAGVYAFIAGSPMAYIDYYGLSPQKYGFYFALSIIGVMLSNVINTRCIERLGNARMMRIGAIGATISGSLLLLSGLTDTLGFYGLLVSLVIFAAMNGFIVANSLAGAMDNHPQNAGSISALVGGLQYTFAMLGTFAVGLFSNGTPLAMCIIMLLAGVATLFAAGLKTT